MTASCALVTEDKVVAEMSINNKMTHSQTLLPMIRQMIESAQVGLADIDAIALAEGPGSFTGLRIGAALAKGLGLALDKKLIGISTIDAMAYASGPSEGLICPMIDARNETVYTGLYRWNCKGFEIIHPTAALSVYELGELIAQTADNRHILLSGDGAALYADLLRQTLTENGSEKTEITIAPVHLRAQRAAAVGALALHAACEGQAVGAGKFVPDYHRITQAERMKKLRESQK